MRINSITTANFCQNNKKIPTHKPPVSSNRKNTQVLPAYYAPVSFTGIKPASIELFWKSIATDSGKIWQYTEKGLENIDNSETLSKLHRGFQEIERFTFLKEGLVQQFCEKTGFPNLAKVSETIDNEILRNAEDFAEKNNSKVLFAGYDINNSIGKRMALPGSDCDGLLFVLSDGDYYSLAARLGVTENLNRRIVNIHSGYLPEVFKLSEIYEGLSIAHNALGQLQKELSAQDYKRFAENITYQGKDFLKSAEFNLRLVPHVPKEKRNLVAMTGYFVEYLRSGKVLQNELNSGSVTLIQSSPFYQYSNIVREEAFKPLIKQKIQARKEIEKNFDSLPLEEKYQLVKNLILSSYEQQVAAQYEKYFKVNGNGFDVNTEMGNLLEMYQKLWG